jgi:hypothetical protein
LVIMYVNKLLLLIYANQHTATTDQSTSSQITGGENSIVPSQNVKNLGTINKLCKSFFYYLYYIWKIRNDLSKQVTATLVRFMPLFHAVWIIATVYCTCLQYLRWPTSAKHNTHYQNTIHTTKTAIPSTGQKPNY